MVALKVISRSFSYAISFSLINLLKKWKIIKNFIEIKLFTDFGMNSLNQHVIRLNIFQAVIPTFKRCFKVSVTLQRQKQKPCSVHWR